MENNSQKKESLFNSEYMKIFARISVWIITPVIFSLIVGNYFDNKYHTEPWILIGALAVSFTVSMIVIVKIAKEYMNKEDGK